MPGIVTPFVPPLCMPLHMDSISSSSKYIQPSTPSSKGRWPTLISPLPWSLSAWQMTEGLEAKWIDFGLLVQRPKPRMGCNGCGHFCSGPLQRHCQTGWYHSYKCWGCKCQKYHDLQSNYHFQPVTIETTGVYGKSTAPFLSGLAKKLADVSGDPRERQWLHQHLSLAVVRGNAASTLACVQVWSDILFFFLVTFNVLTKHRCLPLAAVSMYSYRLPNPCFFFKFYCSLSRAVLPCALVKYLVKRTAYDQTTAWCYVPHCSHHCIFIQALMFTNRWFAYCDGFS